MASMYTSSNQYPLPKVLAAQCKTATTTAMEPTAPAANRLTGPWVAVWTAAVVTRRHDTVGPWHSVSTLRCANGWLDCRMRWGSRKTLRSVMSKRGE
jgi:hypothetical protein